MKIKFLPSEEGFLGLDQQDAFLPHEAKAWIIPFGLEASVSYGSGTAKGPEAIINASHQVELFDEVFWSEPFRKYGVATLDALQYPADDIETALGVLEDVVNGAIANQKFPLILGGEHSLTAGVMSAFAGNYDQITLLQFDAHADLRDGYDGEHFSHASAMRRCLDLHNVKLVSVGIRNISIDETFFLESQKERINIFWAKDKGQHTTEQIVKAVGSGPVYISFDLDGLDSSLMPATGTPEPGGLFWDETIDIIAEVAKNSEVVGADIVELAPKEGFHACDFLAAKLAYKILSYALVNRGTQKGDMGLIDAG